MKYSATEHCYGIAAGIERGGMRKPVYSRSKPAYYRKRARKFTYYPVRNISAVLRCSARADDGKARIARDLDLAFVIKHGRRIDFRLHKQRRIYRIGARDVFDIICFKVLFCAFDIFDVARAL